MLVDTGGPVRLYREVPNPERDEFIAKLARKHFQGSRIVETMADPSWKGRPRAEYEAYVYAWDSLSEAERRRHIETMTWTLLNWRPESFALLKWDVVEA